MLNLESFLLIMILECFHSNLNNKLVKGYISVQMTNETLRKDQEPCGGCS